MANSDRTYQEPWGWSKLDTYRTCPKQFWFRYIQKVREVESEALRHGSAVHKAIESYLNGWTSELVGFTPAHAWMERLKKLKSLKPRTEAAWGVDKDWRPLKSWFEQGTWLRAKSDAYHIDGPALVLTDFKSGKYRVPSADQIELYAIIGHAFHPDVSHVRTSFWFVEQDSVPHEEVYEAKKLVNLRMKYEQEAAKLYKDRKFPEKPGQHCRYCSFSRQKGGTCQY